VLLLGFLLVGVCRTLGLLQWRLDKMELTAPRRVGRDGLKPGTPAPDFTLVDLQGGEVSLGDFAGRRVLLAFVHSQCEPCSRIAVELNRIDQSGGLQVLAVAGGALHAVRRWAEMNRAAFPVLVQEDWSVSRRYQVYATPFAFLIDEKGTIRSQGIITNRKYLGYLLAGVDDQEPTAVELELPRRHAEGVIAAGES
jgi:peroxiredoxin